MLKTSLKKICIYALLFIAIFMIFDINYRNHDKLNFSKYSNTKMFIAITIGMVVIAYFLTEYKLKNFIYLIMIAGIFMRISYMLQTAYNVRAHDLGSVSNLNNGFGHANYIITIFKTGHLPTSNAGQFYHPPLYYYLSAGLLRVFKCLHRTNDLILLFQSVKMISCFASCVTLIVMKKICDALEITDRAKIIIIALMSFFPNYLLMAGRVNNDALAFMFMMIIVLYTIRFIKDPSIHNILGLAFGFGLGIMTKINVAVMAFWVAPVFIYKFIKSFRNQTDEPLNQSQYSDQSGKINGMQKGKINKGLIYQYLVFIGIAFPVALWYPIRNYVKFKQPLSYVADVGKNSGLYCGNVSLWKRFLFFPIKEVFSPVFIDIHSEYNVLKYTLKSSMFGEFTFDKVNMSAKFLIAVNMVMIIIMCIFTIYIVFFSKNIRRVIRYGIPMLGLIFIVSYIVFNLKYPYTCTMDFRYIGMVAFTGAISLGVGFDKIQLKNKTIETIIRSGIIGAVGLFSVLSMYIYCSV